MKGIDVRKIFVDAQEQLRYDVINLCEDGKTYTRISNLLKIIINSICKFCKNYSLNGDQWLKNKKKCRKLGEKCTLIKENIKKHKKIILNKIPIDFGISYCLWSRRAIQNFIFILWPIAIKNYY